MMLARVARDRGAIPIKAQAFPLTSYNLLHRSKSETFFDTSFFFGGGERVQLSFYYFHAVFGKILLILLEGPCVDCRFIL